jgi:hypothetical protein
MIAYTFGPLLFGWYGIFLMPMLLVLVFHFARLVLPELVQGRAIQPTAVDPGVADPTGGVAVHAPGSGPTTDTVAATVPTDTESVPVEQAERRDETAGTRSGGETEDGADDG